jgi:hypothetical protein
MGHSLFVELIRAERTEVEHEVIAEDVEFGTQWLLGLTAPVPEWVDLAVQCNAEKASAVSDTMWLVLCQGKRKERSLLTRSPQSHRFPVGS